MNVTTVPPPILTTPAPKFTQLLTNQIMTAGDSLIYNLPPVSNPNNAMINSSLAAGAPRWVLYDDKNYVISVSAGSTDAKTAGPLGTSYSVSISLQDSAGGKGLYSFKIIVNPVVILNLSDGKETNLVINYPVPKIEQIT